MSAWELHVDTHEPWSGVYAADCVYCMQAQRRAVFRDVRRQLQPRGVEDFGDDEVTQPDAVLPPGQLVNG